MQEMMLAKAKELLQSGAVQRVLGWQTGEFVYDITPAVFTSAEEMAYPQAQEPELAAKLDEIAKFAGFRIVPMIFDEYGCLVPAPAEEKHPTSRRRF